MRSYCIRLVKGLDLLLSIQQFAEMYEIKAATVVCGVGCISRAKLRNADRETTTTFDERMEIMSLTGTVSSKRAHLHMSASRSDLSVIGGHLFEGTIIDNTCELILIELDNVLFDSTKDPDTGFEELLIRRPSFKD
ncbi:MAG: DNA-binding protein [Clostridia bacterium]|nr:DNA-binding protein [Clostridia bacterium]